MGKKIISFCLYGGFRIYCIGAIKNAILAKKIFPEWKCRYYCGTDVPSIIINKLKEFDNVEIINIDFNCNSKKWKDDRQYGMMWRFYVMSDPDVDYWLVRDADSRISWYEKKCSDIWIEKDKLFHSQSDKNEPLIRGCAFGGKGMIVKNIENVIEEYLNKHNISKKKTPFYTDENFMNNHILPNYIKDNYIRFPRMKNSNCDFEYKKMKLTKFSGQVLDENDNLINKNRMGKTTAFNENYDDLEKIICDFYEKIKDE